MRTIFEKVTPEEIGHAGGTRRINTVTFRPKHDICERLVTSRWGLNEIFELCINLSK
jgi:hypothetical protein